MKKVTVFMFLASCCAGSAFAAALTLVTPNGGELCLGRAFNITWTATGIPAGTRVKLVLFQGETRIGTIAEDLGVGASPYRWTVGRHDTGSVAAGSRYRIRLRTMDNSLEDFDNTPFSIAACPGLTVTPVSRSLSTRPFPGSGTTVRVTLPNTGVEVLHGDITGVRWTYAHARPDQRLTIFLIRYPADCRSAESREEINLGSMPVETGAFTWEVSPLIQPCDHCTIRLSPQVAGDFAADESDECFVLRRRPVVRLLAPNGGESFTRGSPLTIAWEADNLLPHMRIQVLLLSCDSAGGACTILRQLAKLPIEYREYNWPGDAAVAAGRYAIEVVIVKSEWTGAGYAKDRSDSCFSFR